MQSTASCAQVAQLEEILEQREIELQSSYERNEQLENMVAKLQEQLTLADPDACRSARYTKKKHK